MDSYKSRTHMPERVIWSARCRRVSSTAPPRERARLGAGAAINKRRYVHARLPYALRIMRDLFSINKVVAAIAMYERKPRSVSGQPFKLRAEFLSDRQRDHVGQWDQG
ncbi:hypothetical protein EVAR_6463_1 [Eumeta japonica]|uniref:Uncharacterized protein n=1 Tax=Eumeta variegata TaxID=151549 RepID=A0A4C1SQF3_EUMVA|nr:hypothetical protein EVAR_6463_1 [Eumeta japonica]